MYGMKDRLRALRASIDDNQVTVVVSGTGSGKTVCCPPLVLKQRVLDGLVTGKVVVTTPKRVTTLNAANTAALTLDVPLGREVGYVFRNAPKDSMDRDRTRLLFATDGFLLAESRSDPTLSAYAAVIIDEAHERPVPTDLLLSVVRKALRQRPELRLVIMSATIDPDLFLSYFSEFRSGLVEVSGSPMYPVEMRFSQKDSSPDSVVQDGVRAIRRILSTDKDVRDVLMFVSTSREAMDGCRTFRKACDSSSSSSSVAVPSTVCSETECATLYSKMEDDARDRALAPPGDDDVWQRKVIFATNVAESSLTLKTLTHVVDSGLQLTSRWDPAIHGTCMTKSFASKAQIRQRIGRVGRTSKGTAVLMYTKARFESLDPFPTASILTVDLSDHLLAALHSPAEPSVSDVVNDFAALLTPPLPAQVTGAIRFLQFYGIIDVWRRRTVAEKEGASEEDGGANDRLSLKESRSLPPSALDGRVTSHGRWVHFVMLRLRLDVWNALLVCAGLMFGCRDDACILATILDACGGDLGALWWTPPQGDSNKKKRPFPAIAVDASSDHVTLINIYRRIFLRHKNDKHALSDAGLAYGTWFSIHERLVRNNLPAVRDIKMQASFVRQMTDRCPLYRIESPSRGIIRALAASRMFHLAARTRHSVGDNGRKMSNGITPKNSNDVTPNNSKHNGGPRRGGGWTTLAPDRPVTVRSAVPVFATNKGSSQRPGLLYEHLFSTSASSSSTPSSAATAAAAPGGSFEFKLVTWLDQLPPDIASLGM